MRKLQTYSSDEITVTFDPNLCIHSAICLRTLPAVFDVRRKRWVRPENASADEVAAAVERCPSGALRWRSQAAAAQAEAAGEAAEAPRTFILASRDGPLLVEGAFALYDEEGEPIPAAGRAALCRCGGSRNKPFCDGSHRERAPGTDGDAPVR